MWLSRYHHSLGKFPLLSNTIHIYNLDFALALLSQKSRTNRSFWQINTPKMISLLEISKWYRNKDLLTDQIGAPKPPLFCDIKTMWLKIIHITGTKVVTWTRKKHIYIFSLYLTRIYVKWRTRHISTKIKEPIAQRMKIEPMEIFIKRNWVTLMM